MRIPYKSSSGSSGVISYEFLDDAIILEFRNGTRYLYNAESPGTIHVAAMRRLAAQGRGLATYVSQHVQENYATKLPRNPPQRKVF